MGKMLFLSIPSYGHVNPTLGVVDELVKCGEEVVYYSSEEFRERIENTGAIFKSYNHEIIQKPKVINQNTNKNRSFMPIIMALESCERTIEQVLDDVKDTKFDYIGYGAMLPFGKLIAQILRIPSFSSFEVFATTQEIQTLAKVKEKVSANDFVMNKYREVSNRIKEKYGIEIPKIADILFNKGDINFAYTSEYFVSHIENYDNTFKFIGPPVYNIEEDLSNFPYKEIEGKRVIYISLGTVFGSFNTNLYDIFLKAFKEVDAAIVMTAYNTDLSEFDIPKNFIIRNYISQGEILKYAEVAVTHAGMNSTNDLLVNNIPFVAIPLGADQHYMASRSEELGACISLDKDKLTPEILRDAVNKLLTEAHYKENIKKINDSFRECGGYKRAAKEILSLKA